MKPCLYLIVFLHFAHAQFHRNPKPNLLTFCPQMIRQTFKGYVPRGNTSAGTYTDIKDAVTEQQCVGECCLKPNCNVVFMNDNDCYHIECASNEVCLPTKSPNQDESLQMVLVRPTAGDGSWKALLELENYEEAYRDLLQNYEDDREGTSCTMNTNSCPPNEECIQNFMKSRAGTCQCKENYRRESDRRCYLIDTNLTTPASKKQLRVQAETKQIRLPENEVSLRADVDPPPNDGEKYNYEWTSLRKPEGSNAVKQQKDDVMHLINLSEGLYTFKVNVSSENGYGETFVNVTVLPPSRINKPPHIVIADANQTIKLPNTAVVLDASATTDDGGSVAYHWDLQQGPIGYQPKLTDASTLQLNLTRAGNYTFKLTVTDSDKATSTALANITVLKVTDYPPEANAGEDKIIYLPHNQIILNGNQSTDDHNITTWEWTKTDANKAVDMQDTRTPYLKLSDLEEGIYTFQLKVTDSANNSNTASVHVYVKPPTNQPPIARIYEQNLTISLPQTWVILDATNSSDDNKIVAFKWEKIDGPSNVAFANQNASRTNVTGLTKGVYAFKVSVTDDNNNVASAIQYVIVNQNKNQKPIANAGGDQVIELPRNVIYLNGSKSSDDLAIVKWKWQRTKESLAFGRIAEQSDESPILILTDLVQGKLIFNLTVSDEQGLSDTQTVQLTIKSDPKMYYLIDMSVLMNYQMFSEDEFESLTGKLALLMQDSTKLQVRELRKNPMLDDQATIRFYVEDVKTGLPINANLVVQHLRDKLKIDAGILGFHIAKLQTTICQNNCSGHGVCDEVTRKCICEAFWMSDLFKVYLSSGSGSDSDCSWSVLYVVLGVVCAVVAIIGSIWGLIFLCLSRCSCKTRSPKNYKLIENSDDLPQYNARKVDLSDSDTDSDIVFESRNKLSTRYGNDCRNGHKTKQKNRRVKT